MLNQNFKKVFKKNKTLLCCGPMSLNIVDALDEVAKEFKIPIILIASRRQIEAKSLGGGYVNNWTTEKFAFYIKKKKNKYLYLARDHGGPWQGTADIQKKISLKYAMASAKKSFKVDIKNNFKFIHIDTSEGIEKPSFGEAMSRLKELYKFCYQFAKKNKKKIFFEIGTEEQSIKKHNLFELKVVLSEMYFFCKKNKLPPVSFIVIQSGTKVLETENIGNFKNYTRKKDLNYRNLNKALKICNKFKVLMKEHNTDYLPFKALRLHPKIGIHSANIAPELGVAETKSLIRILKKHKMNNYLNTFLNIAYKSKKWKKWLKKNTKANKLKKSIIAGHYVFSDKRILLLKKNIQKNLSKKNIDLNIELKKSIRETIIKYFKAFNLLK